MHLKAENGTVQHVERKRSLDETLITDDLPLGPAPDPIALRRRVISRVLYCSPKTDSY
jgi:hypothetical protein